MTTKQIETVKQSWEIVARINPYVVGELFYNRLFEIAPEVRPLFRSPMPEQSKKLLAMIGYVIHKLDALDDIIGEVGKLAQRHTQYGVKDEHYQVVGQALLWTLEQGLAGHWNDEMKESWTACYTILSSAMIEASQQKAA